MQTPFGWHLLRAQEIVPEQVQPFDTVKEELRRELSLEQAANQLPDFATRLDDELAAGTSFDEAAPRSRASSCSSSSASTAPAIRPATSGSPPTG